MQFAADSAPLTLSFVMDTAHALKTLKAWHFAAKSGRIRSHHFDTGSCPMLKRFLPQQENFFDLFQQTADTLVESTSHFHNMLCELGRQQEYVDIIAALEMKANDVTRHTFTLLHTTFITPFDRHDIHTLTSGLDDIADLVNRCAQRFPFYNLNTVPQEMVQLAMLSVQATTQLREAINRLHMLRKAPEIVQYCEAIDKVECEAHKAILAGEKRLFAEENDFKQFYKLKEVYTLVRSVVKKCQDVANLIKGIILEYA